MASCVWPTIKSIFSIISIIFLILCLIYLFKIKNNAKDEPIPRDQYIDEEYSDFYIQGDFCYEHYYKYDQIGAFEDFDIRMEKMKKYATALISIYFISLAALVLSLLLIILSCTICKPVEKCLSVILIILIVINSIAAIIGLVFFIILSYHYYRSGFDDFERFSECKYLSQGFLNDYHFVSVVKDSFKKVFIINILTFILSCVENIFKMFCK